jgi:hypothetical protein
MKLLKYTQKSGFEEIDSPFEWPEDGMFDDYLKAGGFGGEIMYEEADGQFAYNEGIRHWYNDDNGNRFTVVSGANRDQHIFTENSAEHMALRIALAPLAHVWLVDTLAMIRSDHGTLEKYQKKEREEERRERQHHKNTSS